MCFQATRDNTDVALEYLTDVVSGQTFKPWELSRSVPRLKLDLASRAPATQAMELLHEVSPNKQRPAGNVLLLRIAVFYHLS